MIQLMRKIMNTNHANIKVLAQVVMSISNMYMNYDIYVSTMEKIRENIFHTNIDSNLYQNNPSYI